MTVRRSGVVALSAALVVLLVGPAAAGPEQQPPEVSARALAESVTTVDLRDAVTVPQLDGTVIPLEQREQQGARTTLTVSSDVLFAFASAEVTAEAAGRLRAQAAEVPVGAAVSVVGHTDAVGDDAANDALSLQRAEAVAAVLRAAAPSLVITAEGRGEREPVAPNSRGAEDDPEGRALNRRVVLTFEG